MRYYPLFLDLKDKRVVIIGGGDRGLAKVRLMLKTQAHITLIARHVDPELAELAESGTIRWWGKSFAPADLDGADLAYAATGIETVDAQVSAAARARRILVNAVDTPHLCDFLTPALVDRDPVVVAIGTEGAAPVLARELKSHLDAHLPVRLGAFARFANSLREGVKAHLPAGDERRSYWTAFFSGATRRLFLAGEVEAAHKSAAVLMAQQTAVSGARAGFVWIVGAGPGDPELLTLKAHRALQEADVIVVDRLVDPRILDFARRDARQIFVGKTPGKQSISQHEINDIIISEAKAGRIVVRLKGGDPFVFGRGGEEVAALDGAGIGSAIVPGITAAAACSASARLPLTHREAVRSFCLLTGATAQGAADHDWPALARSGQAFGIYMGVGTAGHIEHQLLSHGIAANTPVVIVENGTRPEERIIETRASALAAAVNGFGIKGPALIYVGLHWDQSGIARPDRVEIFADAGIVVALPRAATQAGIQAPRRSAGGSQ